MYTQVSFGDFLARILENIKSEREIEFDEYPNSGVQWSDGDWLYEIRKDFSVRVLDGFAGTRSVSTAHIVTFHHRTPGRV